MDQRSEFSSKIGFILAAAGSAVGLGNIWRFPYLAAKYGGGLFVLIYIFFITTFGYAIMTSEIAIGRKTRLSPIGAYESLDKKYKFLGVIAVLVAALIVPYYSVIGGWIIKYLVVFLTGGYMIASQDGFFIDFITSPLEPVLWQAAFVFIAAAVVLKGIKDGIEKANRILMPVLIILSLGIGVYAMTLPGAVEGLKYYMIPDFSRFSVEGVLAALGQMFYSLSLAMGIMITYGSYLNKGDDIKKSVKQIEIFDSGVAILAGFMIVPAVFAFSGGSEEALSAGPGLMFITLPKVFESMAFSSLIGSTFFLMVLFAAITSGISLMEVVVSTICDKYEISRNKSVLLTTLFVIVMGIPSSLGNGIWSGFTLLDLPILDFFDFVTNAVLMPIGALLMCLFIGYRLKADVILNEMQLESDMKSRRFYTFMIKYVAPVFIVAVLLSSVLSTFGVITI
ncbi:sodium-dependent transporter [Alkalibacter saccharofermentans]|uniref:Transporter n=1 Tax=Alkalibacter saccharofermentans DSM 14828 TaxID=1120975 RepID=A0A1M4VUQ4_9FIRM|nr:sodium-dependent transporter [Alkalibacter saccharofermentans]SHE72667.1 neurotransmitter:Na+ symporter, NSS family [Alkalibacter saccharofermentans DSM 14828]